MSVKVLVLGSNSFSGATFSQFALQQGAHVIGVSRSDEPHSAFLPYRWIGHDLFKFYKLDINTDLPSIEALLHEQKPDYVVNFAAQSMVAQSWEYPEHWYQTNVMGLVRLSEALRKLPFLKKYVHVTTPEVYGNCSDYITEEAPFNPSTPYAVSRAAGDMHLRAYSRTYDFPVVFTRAANVYGAGQQLYRIIPRTILFILLGRKLQLHGGGVSTRSFIHMRDVSEATWKTMQNGRDGNTYHISTNEVVSIRELVERICTKLGVHFEDYVEVVDERMGKDFAYHLDSTKLRMELGWQDRVDLNQGLDECITWVRTHFEVLKAQPYDYIHKA